MNKHPHEEVILAYYRGEQIQLMHADGEWIDVPPYAETLLTGVGNAAPNFSTNRAYRIKPQPTKTHAVELTQEEIEALHIVLRRVGGNPNSTARGHCDSAYEKLHKILPESRAERLLSASAIPLPITGGESVVVDGSISFKKGLPE